MDGATQTISSMLDDIYNAMFAKCVSGFVLELVLSVIELDPFN